MLKFYLTTVIIWMIIIYSMCAIFEKTIKDKGWAKNKSSSSKLKIFAHLFCISAVPIVRFFMLITIFVMACMTPEEVEKLKESKNHE